MQEIEKQHYINRFLSYQMNYTNEHFKENDHWGTPKSAWQSLQHLRPPGITLFDPFYYDGQSGKDMKEVFPKNKIIHEEGIIFSDKFSGSSILIWLLSVFEVLFFCLFSKNIIFDSFLFSTFFTICGDFLKFVPKISKQKY